VSIGGDSCLYNHNYSRSAQTTYGTGRWPLGVDVSEEVEGAELKQPRAHNNY